MRTSPYALIAGFSALSIAFLGARMIAPFYGLGPFLGSVLIVVAFLAVTIGVVLGGRATSTTPRALGMAMLGAGAWMLIAPWVRRPLLQALEPAGLRLDVTLAAIVLIGPPLALLGAALARAVVLALAGTLAPARSATRVLGAFLFGVAIAAPLVPFVLLPRIGVTGLAILIGAILVVGGILALQARAGSVALVLCASLVAIGFGALARRGPLPARVVALAHSMGREIRLVEHRGSRYLLEDGTIHAVVEPVTWAGLRRPEAALGLVQLLVPEPGRMLILGLRGGSLAKRFATAGWTVDVVESDSAQARVARAWLGLLPGEAQLFRWEPRDFLRRTRDSYDLIVLDAFADNFVRPELVTRECIAQAKARLYQGGLLALVIESQGWEDPLIRTLAATIGSEFATVWALPTGEPPNALGGTILLAAERPLEIPDASVPQPFEHLADPLAHWNAVQMSHAWANRFEPDRRGMPVLTDDRIPAEPWGERINDAARRELHRFFTEATSDSGGRSPDPSW